MMMMIRMTMGIMKIEGPESSGPCQSLHLFDCLEVVRLFPHLLWSDTSVALLLLQIPHILPLQISKHCFAYHGNKSTYFQNFLTRNQKVPKRFSGWSCSPVAIIAGPAGGLFSSFPPRKGFLETKSNNQKNKCNIYVVWAFQSVKKHFGPEFWRNRWWIFVYGSSMSLFVVDLHAISQLQSKKSEQMIKAFSGASLWAVEEDRASSWSHAWIVEGGRTGQDCASSKARSAFYLFPSL